MEKRFDVGNSLSSELSRLNVDEKIHYTPYALNLDREEIKIIRRDFRIALKKIHKKCQITGMKYGCIASHIKPLIKCRSKDECVDPANGLYLCKTIDEVFDKGWISFDDDGRLLVSSEFRMKNRDDLRARFSKCWLEGRNKLAPPSDADLAKRQQAYMRYHRFNVFRSKERYGGVNVTEAENCSSRFDLSGKNFYSEKSLRLLRELGHYREARQRRKIRALTTGIVWSSE